MRRSISGVEQCWLAVECLLKIARVCQRAPWSSTLATIKEHRYIAQRTSESRSRVRELQLTQLADKHRFCLFTDTCDALLMLLLSLTQFTRPARLTPPLPNTSPTIASLFVRLHCSQTIRSTPTRSSTACLDTWPSSATLQSSWPT